MKMQAARKQQGFTIIELVVVILLLGILAATALPRFIDVTDEAHDAAFDGVVGGFTTGIAMYRAQFIATGQPTSVTLDNATLAFDTVRGYPAVPLDSILPADSGDIAACVEIFNDALQSGRPTVGQALNNSSAAFVMPVTALTNAGVATTFATGSITDQTLDFAVSIEVGSAAVAGPPAVAAIPATCFYVYTGQYRNATAAVAAGRTGLPFFTYSPTGQIRRGTINAGTVTYIQD